MFKLSAILFVFLLCFCEVSLAQEKCSQTQHGISASFFGSYNGWGDILAPTLLLGYKQRKQSALNITPYANAGVGVFRGVFVRDWNVNNLNKLIFLEGGFSSSIQSKVIALKLSTGITASYSPPGWAHSDLAIGPSASLSLGTGTGIKNWELNLILAGIDVHLFTPGIRWRENNDIIHGTLRTPGLNFTYYFPSAK